MTSDIHLGGGSSQVREHTLSDLLLGSLLILAVVGIPSTALGWWFADRALGPISRVTHTASRIAAGSLGQRIALTGPQDEVKQLADTFDAMLERLDQSFATQRRFIAHATHELRTLLTDGTQAKNIYWVQQGAATLGASSTFVGTILSNAAITVGATSLVDGRALSVGAAVTLDGDTFDTPS